MKDYFSVLSLYHTLYAESIAYVKSFSYAAFFGGFFTDAAKFPLCVFACVCYNVCSNMYWRLSPMASTKTPSARELRKKKMVRVIAIVACAALLITAILPYVASALY